MKKSIITIGTVGIMLVYAYCLGNIASNQTVDAQTEISQEATKSKETDPEKRFLCGNYYDYMVIETVDGNEWLLDDTGDSPYIENGAAVFEDGELVQMVFDTMGTDTVTDDVIVEVRSIDKRCK